LDSWKEIAVYLNRGVTTVQRWERDEGLPVHRQQHDALGSIYAYKHELEAWRVKRAVRSDTDEPASSGKIVAAKLGATAGMTAKGLIGGALVLGFAIGAISQRSVATNSPKPVRRLTIVPSTAASMVLAGSDRSLTITPDGSRIVYVGGNDGSRLFVRALDQLDATAIAGVGSPRHPFMSPDGRWIGFFDRNMLKKVPITGGPPTLLMDSDYNTRTATLGPAGATTLLTRRVGSRGAAWGSDGRIAFSLEGRLLRISSDGGAAEVLASPDLTKGEAAYCWPEYLPNGRGLLFTILPAGDWSEKGSKVSIQSAQVAVLDFRTKKQKVLFEGGSHARYMANGDLVFASGGDVKAVPFDLSSLTLSGTPKTVIRQVSTSTRGAANFDVATDGTLVYAPGAADDDLVTLAWVDRRGQEEPVGIAPFIYRHPRVSPDGTRLALDSPRDLGVMALSTRTMSWFGVGPASQLVWTPDGRRLIFASTRGGPAELYSQMADGSQTATRLTINSHNQFPNAISPNGRDLVLREDATSPDLMLLVLPPEHAAEPLIQTPFRELNADFSPDGKFLTYQSNQSGEDEVYVQPYPNVAGKRWMISTGGGRQPMWAPGGREIYYVSADNAMMSVPIQDRGGFATGAVTKLFEGPYYFGGSPISGRVYDVSPRDGRFLMLKPAADTTKSDPRIQVVLNWFEELKPNVNK
jgi:serine/threonine-protein kinase